MGWPYLIHESLLRRIVKRWNELTLIFRSTPSSPLYRDWICDMFGMAIALAESKENGELINETGMPPYGEKNPTFFHFCYEINERGKVYFNKKNYIPFTKLETHPDLYLGSRNFIKRMNQIIENHF
jgi:hypothetical protein